MEHYIITLLAREMNVLHHAKLTDVLRRRKLRVESTNILSKKPGRFCAEFLVAATMENSADFHAPLHTELRAELQELAEKMNVDLVLQAADGHYRPHPKLATLDMDSTLIEEEIIDELAKEAGAGEQVAAITAAAMGGELKFAESLQRRVALLEGLNEAAVEKVAGRMTLMEGAERLINALRARGCKTAILSGGFTFAARRLQQQLGIDTFHANELEIVDGKVTGRITGPVVDGERKAALLRELAKKEGIALEETMSVGDGANDLPMLAAAGLGVAFRAKPLVRRKAKHSISVLGLDGVLYLLGLDDDEIPA